jgi:hypothetical protein
MQLSSIETSGKVATMPKYQLNDGDLAGRVGDFAADEDATSLDHAIALTNGLIESAVNNKQIHAVSNLLTVLSRLTTQSDQRKWRAGEVLYRGTVLEVANQMVSALITEFQDVCPDWRERVEVVAKRLIGVIDEASNPLKMIEEPK